MMELVQGVIAALVVMLLYVTYTGPEQKAEQEIEAACSEETQTYERVIAVIGALALIAIIVGGVA